MMPERCCPECGENNIEKRGEIFLCASCKAEFDANGVILGHASPANRSSNGHSTKSGFGDKRG
jgi:uncharacterized Zn finger protein (UPF0148 family)